MPRVGPTHTRAQTDCVHDLASCPQSDGATSELLVTETAQVDVTQARNQDWPARVGGRILRANRTCRSGRGDSHLGAHVELPTRVGLSNRLQLGSWEVPELAAVDVTEAQVRTYRGHVLDAVRPEVYHATPAKGKTF